MWLTLILVLSGVTYRVTRFALKDSLIEGPRERLKMWIIGRVRPEWLGDKLLELISCQFCFSVWVAGGAVLLTDWQTSVPLPVWTWLAACSGSLLIWSVIDGTRVEEIAVVEQE